MKDRQVKSIMIPLTDYATVSENESLAFAIKVLKEAQGDKRYKYKHRAVLVYDEAGNICGKLSMRDILKALEPKYRQFGQATHAESFGLSRFGFSNDFLNSLLINYSLWDETLEELVKKTRNLKVKEVMYTPSLGEYVDQDAPLAEAVHQFILGCHQALLVLKNDKVVGVLRLSDLFDMVVKAIK